jgi:hypothetical protein
MLCVPGAGRSLHGFVFEETGRRLGAGVLAPACLMIRPTSTADSGLTPMRVHACRVQAIGRLVSPDGDDVT